MAAALTLLTMTGLLLLVVWRVAPMPSMGLATANGTRPTGRLTGLSDVVALLAAVTVLAAGPGMVAGWPPAPTTTTIQSTTYDAISTLVVGAGDVGDVRAGSGRAPGETSEPFHALLAEVDDPQEGGPDVLRHYTDETGRAAIEASGSILPSGEGAIFLTPDIYTSGATAATRLAMTRTTPTGYFEVPRETVSRLCGPHPVDPWPPGSDGGGGTEYWTNQAIDAKGLTWVPIGP